MKIKYKLEKSALYVYLIGELDECSANSVRDTMKKKGFINVEKIFRVQYDVILQYFQ